jgi:hypothetical protein
LIHGNHLDRFTRVLPIVRSIVHPAGRTTFFKIFIKRAEGFQAVSGPSVQEYKDQLDQAVQPLKDDGFFVETTLLESADIFQGSLSVVQIVKDLFFPPNTYFCLLDQENHRDEELRLFLEKISAAGFGVIVLSYFDKVGFYQQKVVNLWIRRQSPNIDLAVLISLQLRHNWDGHLRIVQVVPHENQKEEAVDYVLRLKELLRMPAEVEVIVLVGEFKEQLKTAPSADINIFGMQEHPDIKMIRDVSEQIQTSVLFLRDSEHESAVA